MRAYADYSTHARPGRATENDSALRRRWARLRHGYLNHRWDYALKPANAAGGFVVPMMPNARRLDEAVRRLPFPGPGARLLDVGCGNGDFLMFMARLGWNAEGLDPDVEAIRLAREAGLKARVGTAADLTEQDGRFDAITLNHVLEHVHDPVGTLVRIREHLKPGGLVWVATPNVAAPGHRLFRRDWLGLDPPRHLLVLSREGLTGLVRGSGFARIRYELPTTHMNAIFLRDSNALSTGRDPSRETASLSGSIRARYWLAQRVAPSREESGEELVVLAA